MLGGTPASLAFGEIVKIKPGGRHRSPKYKPFYAICVEEGAPVHGGGYRHKPIFVDTLDLDEIKNLGYASLYEDEYETTGLYADEEFVRELYRRQR